MRIGMLHSPKHWIDCKIIAKWHKHTIMLDSIPLQDYAASVGLWSIHIPIQVHKND